MGVLPGGPARRGKPGGPPKSARPPTGSRSPVLLQIWARRLSANAVEELMKKIPEVTLLFWIMKICAITLGETAGDQLLRP